MNRQAVGTQIGATTSPAELGAVAAEADQLGYGEIWLAEDYFDLGGIASAATALAATDQSPIGIGVHGPASLRLSGELADGTLLGWFNSPSCVAWARGRIDEGRARAGREDVHELVALC